MRSILTPCCLFVCCLLLGRTFPCEKKGVRERNWPVYIAVGFGQASLSSHPIVTSHTHTTHIAHAHMHKQHCIHKLMCNPCNSTRSSCLFAVSQQLISLHPHVFWLSLFRNIGCLSKDTKRGSHTHTQTDCWSS